MQMKKLGVDLDNTIICYDEAFQRVGVKTELLPPTFIGNKREVKSYLLGLFNGQFKWEKLQGLVYGREILSAHVFPGFLPFLDELKRNCLEIVIISHKTRIAHHDEKNTNLRLAAKSFLIKELILGKHKVPNKNLVFCGTLDEKINRINDENCDLFIDDLEQVFDHPKFPNKCQKILFGSKSDKYKSIDNWKSLSDELFGN